MLKKLESPTSKHVLRMMFLVALVMITVITSIVRSQALAFEEKDGHYVAQYSEAKSWADDDPKWKSGVWIKESCEYRMGTGYTESALIWGNTDEGAKRNSPNGTAQSLDQWWKIYSFLAGAPTQNSAGAGANSATSAAGASAGIASFEGMLRSGINYMLDLSGNLLNNLSNNDIKSYATADFGSMVDGAASSLEAVHKTVVIPIAYVVLAIFFVVALVKMMQKMGSYEAGVDLWQMTLIFLLFAFGKILIDNSWELMVGIYSLIGYVMQSISNVAGANGATFAFDHISDSVQDAGVLIVILIVSFIIMLATLFMTVAVKVILIMRALQIYVYTCLSPLPVATFVSEGSRNIATTFLRRYVAVVGAGIILVILNILMVFVTQASATAIVAPGDQGGFFEWIGSIVLALAPPGAVAFCMMRAGDWARDFVGG